MKKRFLRLAALLLAAVLLLTGCYMPTLGDVMNKLYSAIQLGFVTPFDEMEYVRPDPDQFRQEMDTCMELAQTETDVDTLMESVYTVYGLYYDFATNYYLANIHYCKDMTDSYWSEEYSYCMEQEAQISAAMDQLLYALADSPLRAELESDSFFGEGFFDLYEGDSLWDETFTALMEQESALLDQYYDLNAQAVEVEYYSEEFFSGYGYQIEEVFLELVKVRRQIATYAGYDSYPAFAYEFYFYRDYTPEQTVSYLEQIKTELVPLYTGIDTTVWEPMYAASSEAQTLEYVRQCAAALGGTAQDAFTLLEEAKLYDITYSINKYDASFEVFLYNYYTPYIFVNPTGSMGDQLTFVHEFGHFCSDYASGGSVAGVDVAEVFSQGLEYLSLTRADNGPGLEKMKMAESLCVFVEQAAYASFEHQVYSLEDEELTVEGIRAVYQQTLDEFGLSAYSRDSRDYVLISHFFIVPLYVISYVVSNDAAMQIYQLEQEQTGAGAAVWEENLATMQMYFLEFLEEAGLESPFAEGRVAEIRATFEEKLN